MILFINVIITENRHMYTRYKLPTFCRFDVFKYTLASYSVIPFTKVIIHAELDGMFKHRQDELQNYVNELFKGIDTSLYFTRSTNLGQWKEAAKEVANQPDNLVWFVCNDDHVFIDYDLQMVDEATELLRNEAEPLSSCYFSHWHEVIKCSCSKKLKFPEKVGNFAVTHWNVHDSIQILRKEQFLNYWKLPLVGRDLRRTDLITFDHPHVTKTYIPLREMCRHFDGYWHSTNEIDFLPPLCIPHGFFENDIKILYCSDEQRPDWVIVNPMRPMTKASSVSQGADMRCMLEDLPLFWRSRISKIEVAQEIPRETLLQHRNAVQEFIVGDMPLTLGLCYRQYPWNEEKTPRMPFEWFEAAMRRS